MLWYGYLWMHKIIEHYKLIMLIYTFVNSSVTYFIQMFQVYTHYSWKKVLGQPCFLSHNTDWESGRKNGTSALKLQETSCFSESHTVRDETASNRFFLHGNVILGYEIKRWVHTHTLKALLGFTFFFFFSKRCERK